MEVSNWAIAILCYVGVAFLTFIPVLYAMLQKVKLKTGEDNHRKWYQFWKAVDEEGNEKHSLKKPFDGSVFSTDAQDRLNAHFDRIEGTRVFWKNQAEWNRRFHYYTLYWTIPISVVIPVVTQMIGSGDFSKLFLTVISTHAALLYGLHRALKVESNFKGFRDGESEFYDTYRRMLDNPESFGWNEGKQLETYFKEVAEIRKYVRHAETNNFPSIEEARGKSSST